MKIKFRYKSCKLPLSLFITALDQIEVYELGLERKSEIEDGVCLGVIQYGRTTKQNSDSS